VGVGVVDRAANSIKVDGVADPSMVTMNAFARRRILPSSSATTDGWAGYNSFPAPGHGDNASGAGVPTRRTRHIVCRNICFIAAEGMRISDIENAR
jgi:hypothetical protein